MCGWMTWWYVTPSERYSSRLMMLILFEHSLKRDRGKGIYLLILFSTLLADYISSFLFKIVLLLKKWQTSFISIYDYLYILCHIWICDKNFAQTLQNSWLRHCFRISIQHLLIFSTIISLFIKFIQLNYFTNYN